MSAGEPSEVVGRVWETTCVEGVLQHDPALQCLGCAVPFANQQDHDLAGFDCSDFVCSLCLDAWRLVWQEVAEDPWDRALASVEAQRSGEEQGSKGVGEDLEDEGGTGESETSDEGEDWPCELCRESLLQFSAVPEPCEDCLADLVLADCTVQERERLRIRWESRRAQLEKNALRQEAEARQRRAEQRDLAETVLNRFPDLDPADVALLALHAENRRAKHLPPYQRDPIYRAKEQLLRSLVTEARVYSFEVSRPRPSDPGGTQPNERQTWHVLAFRDDRYRFHIPPSTPLGRELSEGPAESTPAHDPTQEPREIPNTGMSVLEHMAVIDYVAERRGALHEQ